MTKKIELKLVRFQACVQPKEGGDDYMISADVRTTNIANAKKMLEKHLAKKSAIVNDYRQV